MKTKPDRCSPPLGQPSGDRLRGWRVSPSSPSHWLELARPGRSLGSASPGWKRGKRSPFPDPRPPPSGSPPTEIRVKLLNEHLGLEETLTPLLIEIGERFRVLDLLERL